GGRNPVGSAVLGSSCAPPPERQLRHAQGIVKASNADEITIGGLTCAVPPSLAVTVAFNYASGTWASITCSVSKGQGTLVTIAGRR
ncbi:MAG: hypothetical protein KGI93_11640, partial [Acidobacteriota bacterium]|nr:hypothetical protein [Acidobacteriota bacterium]